MKLKWGVVLLVIFAFQRSLATDPNEHYEKQELNQPKRRLTLQNTAEIQSCLVSSGEVGCGMFQCFKNNTCEIRGLHHICLTLLHNAGHFDSQGKSSVKDALRCMALGLRQRFSCVSRRCGAIREMVFALQRECYSKHQLCVAVREHLDTLGELVHFHLLFPTGPYVQVINFLIGCGDEVTSWVGQRLSSQCDQHWGALCKSLSHRSLSQSDTPRDTTIPPTGLPRPVTARENSPEPSTRTSQLNVRQVAPDNATGQGVTSTTF